MQIDNQFQVEAPPDLVWSLFTDLERIAPLLPGARLDEVEKDEHRGTVQVKVGPIRVEYKGVARILEKDEDAGRLKISAQGHGTGGQGDAKAIFDATVEALDGGTQVSVTTDLTVTGRVAQFGRGVMSDVAEKLIGQFAAELERSLTEPERPAPEAQAVEAGQQPRTDQSGTGSDGGDKLDLVKMVLGTRTAKWGGVAVVAVLGAFIAVWSTRRFSYRRKTS